MPQSSRDDWSAALSRSHRIPSANIEWETLSRHLTTSFNGHFGDTGCIAAQVLLLVRENSAQAMAAFA
ncbi:MAG: hypothetical protein HKO95_01080 [Rhodobacteraceae bacterium]|nr:hypothetical protein [Boseongicola sp.]NNK65310.1 hypothetical protein [Paracoccaceae bacterium]